MLRNKLWASSPSKRSKWPGNPLWGLVLIHAPISGSKLWSKVHLAWKKMLKNLQEAPPINVADACQKPVWWGVDFKGGDFNLSQQDALSLYTRGLSTVGDLWCPVLNDIKPIDQIEDEFSLVGHEIPVMQAVGDWILNQYGNQLRRSDQETPPETWLGGYSLDDDNDPKFLIKTCKNWLPSPIGRPFRLSNVPSRYPVYRVGSQSRSVIPDTSENFLNLVRTWTGPLKQARVMEVDKHNSARKILLVYYGRVGRLSHFDPMHWKWKNDMGFTMYNAKIGRELLSDKFTLQKPIVEKWRHEEPPLLQPSTRRGWAGRWASDSQEPPPGVTPFRQG
ncbi:hypothetical protein KC19_VG060400 [Ceratodon purpureus]|uniref:Uncharacterized protein n=1 Tax=Ceratodon purpureus TaxID=3225 RepID=A0A8T0HMY9_CERPU|nr:hypothetical protein KC19_VG060400 [Ceratodon purpureus]